MAGLTHLGPGGPSPAGTGCLARTASRVDGGGG
jgi:hypothetical protein